MQNDVPPPTVTPTEGNLPEFTTLRAETMEERIQKLQRFELVLLTPIQIGDFERNFKAGVRLEFMEILASNQAGHIRIGE